VFFELLAAASPVAKAAATAAATLSPAQQAQLKQLQTQIQNVSANSYVQGLTPLQQHAPWLTHFFGAVFILSALLFVGLLAIQTTKQEGLSGTIGGRVDSAYRGRLGFDGQIARITGGVAVTFVVVATIVSISGI
jgi:preprotein translocase subunit SecG